MQLGGIVSDIVSKAIKAVDRAAFMPQSARHLAGVDAAVSIGYGQTISQPYTVRLMLEWLNPKPGQKILDVGSGSGWTTALLAHIVGAKGKVFAVERIPELLEFGRENCENIGVKNAEFISAGEDFGLPEEAPFDRILISASADILPEKLIDQLKIGGKMVIPVHEDILEITKKSNDSIDIKTHPGFVFVPLL